MREGEAGRGAGWEGLTCRDASVPVSHVRMDAGPNMHARARTHTHTYTHIHTHLEETCHFALLVLCFVNDVGPAAKPLHHG